MKQLGIYGLGTRRVRVFATKGRDGSFNLPEGDMFIGMEHDAWWQCLNVLLHEAYEMAASDNKCRFEPDVNLGDSADGYVFHMTHPQFTEITGQVANFLSQVIPDLAKRYNARK